LDDINSKVLSSLVQSDGFKELTLENIRIIVASNKVGVREEDIFESLISWSERECQRRDLDILPENQYEVLIYKLNSV
jgi:hypothetical protein